MLVVKRTNKHCWDCYVLERDRFGGGNFVVWGWKNGDQKTYFVVMQDNFNALYRRHLVTISPLFIHIKKNEVIFGIKTKQKVIECNVFFLFALSFLKGVDILSWKEINAMCRFMVQCFLVESNSLLLKNGSFFLLFFLSASQMIYTRKN